MLLHYGEQIAQAKTDLQFEQFVPGFDGNFHGLLELVQTLLQIGEAHLGVGNHWKSNEKG